MNGSLIAAYFWPLRTTPEAQLALIVGSLSLAHLASSLSLFHSTNPYAQIGSFCRCSLNEAKFNCSSAFINQFMPSLKLCLT